MNALDPTRLTHRAVWVWNECIQSGMSGEPARTPTKIGIASLYPKPYLSIRDIAVSIPSASIPAYDETHRTDAPMLFHLYDIHML
jgi:hypothetical protein